MRALLSVHISKSPTAAFYLLFLSSFFFPLIPRLAPSIRFILTPHPRNGRWALSSREITSLLSLPIVWAVTERSLAYSSITILKAERQVQL